MAVTAVCHLSMEPRSGSSHGRLGTRFAFSLRRRELPQSTKTKGPPCEGVCFANSWGILHPKAPLCKRNFRATSIQRPPCAKGAPAERVGDCPCYFLQSLQINSIVYTIPPTAAPPPPFAQGRLKKRGWLRCAVSLCWGEAMKMAVTAVCYLLLHKGGL